MSVIVKNFGQDRNGALLHTYTISNSKGMRAEVTDLGASLVGVVVPDKSGRLVDVALGYDNPESYYKNTCFFGAVIGRNCNRIDKAKFTLDGREYQLDVNDNENNLHSGNNGFDRRTWKVVKAEGDSVSFSMKDADMEQNYPGNFEAVFTYTLKEDGSLVFHWECTSDADTVANMTNHTYWNLSGHDSGVIYDQTLMLNAQSYTPVRDSQAIPTGEIADVEGTPMDFRKAKPIGQDIDADFEQLKFVGGYDHNFVIKKEKGEIEKIAEAHSRATGITMEVFSDLPGVQFYAGNFITPDMKGKGGVLYQKRSAFCLEPQYYPNSINQEGFAKPILKAGEKAGATAIFKFSVR